MTLKDKFMSTAPFFMLFITGLIGYLSHLKIYIKIFPYLGDIIGYSIMTNLVFMFIYFRRRFCMATKVCVTGLLIMNIISIIFKTNEVWIYNSIYDLWISLLILVVSLLTLIK